MSSHEDDIRNEFDSNSSGFKDERLNIPTIKYFWQASPLTSNKLNSIPKFLRSIKVFDNFSDYELKQFSHFLHQRSFASDEVIIEEGDSGFGFFIIFSGNVEIFTKRSRVVDGAAEVCQQLIARLTKHEYFGELALLEKQNKRNASAVSKGNSTLISIYKPDIEELIERYPVIGAKFLQGISLIVAQRFNSVTNELRALKEKIIDLEEKLENPEV